MVPKVPLGDPKTGGHRNIPLTRDLLSQLKKRGLKATFFVVGSRVVEYPDILIETYKAGHQIALHTWSHPQLTSMPNEQIVAEMIYSAKAVKQVLGITPTFMRPPFGDNDDRVRYILKKMGFTIIGWNEDSFDWIDGFNTVGSRITEYAKTHSIGTISLQHDLFQKSEPQAAGAIDGMIAGGYKPMPVGECLGVKTWYDEGIWDILGADANGGATVSPATTTGFVPVPEPTGSNNTGPAGSTVTPAPGSLPTPNSRQGQSGATSASSMLSAVGLAVAALLAL
eukprot:jgi/Hompol1/5156/HPOL_004176-RA